MAFLQPKIKEIQKQYKENKKEQAEALMNLYKTEGISPVNIFFPILLIFIQIPILFALYKVFMAGFKPENFSSLYFFINKPENISAMFLGLIDLSRSNYYLAIIAGILQFIQSKGMMSLQPKKNLPATNVDDFSVAMNKQMTYVFPFLTVFIGFSIPAGLALYWITNNLFAIYQQKYDLNNKS